MNIVHYILPRRCGKTSHVIENALASKADKVFIITYSNEWIRNIESKLPIKTNIEVLSPHHFYQKYLGKQSCKDQNVEVFIDEMHQCGIAHNNFRSDIINTIGIIFDVPTSRVIGFSTPSKVYTLKDYVDFEKGVDNHVSRELKNCFMDIDIISKRVPKGIKPIDVSIERFEQLGLHGISREQGNFIQ